MKQCKTCGYLGARSTQNSQLLSADEEMREKGKPSNLHKAIPGGTNTAMIQAYYEFPICYMGLKDIQTESSNNPTNIITIISTPHNCPDHTKYYPGLSPKEHQDKIDQEKAQQLQNQRDQQAHQWQQENLKTIQDGNKSNWRSNTAGAIATIIACILAIILERWLNNEKQPIQTKFNIIETLNTK